MNKEDILTPPKNAKHLQFALEYVATNKAAESYMMAYPGVKRTSAIRRASFLLQQEDIKKFINDYYLYYSDEEARSIIRKNKWVKNLEKIADLPIHVAPNQTLQANVKLAEWNQQLQEIEARERVEVEIARIQSELEEREKAKKAKRD